MELWQIILIVVIISMVLLIAVLFIIAYIFIRAVVYPPRRSLQKALDYHINNNGIDSNFYQNLKKSPWEIKNRQGYTLSGEWIEYDEANTSKSTNNKIIIFVHGHGHNRMGAVKFLKLFLDRGFRVLIYDQINSGISEGNVTTMGLQESSDLRTIIDSIYENEETPSLLGLVGESMGAATIIMEACHDSRPDFIIADCSYADLSEQLVYMLKYSRNLKKFPLFNISNFLVKKFAGFNWQDVSPVKAIQDCGGLKDIPALFVHGEADTYIQPENSRLLYEAKQGYRDLLLIPNARHTEAVCTDPASYEDAIKRLLGQLII